MTSYNSQIGDGKFAIQFETDNRDNYERVQELIRECIDGESKVEPLPCPFCGKETTISVDVDTESSDVAQYQVCCSYLTGGCGAAGAWGRSRSDAIMKWNRRDGK